MRTNWLAILVLLLAFVPVDAVAAPGKDKGSPPLVTVEPVHLQNINPPEEYVGHVQAIQSVKLQGRVRGYLQEIRFQEGSLVHKGDLLYVIEQSQYEARLASARAEVTQAEASLDRAGKRLKRLRSADPDSVPQTQMDEAIAAKKSAKGSLDQAKAQLELAKIDMAYTTVEAPISGRVGKTRFDRGDLVTPSSGPLAQIKQIDPIRVEFSVGEKNISLIQKALHDAKKDSDQRILSVRLRFSDGTAYPHTGRIEFVDNKVDQSTGTIAVWARFDNDSGALIPGEYVKALLTLTKPKKLPVVALSSVQRDKQGPFVFVVDTENTVHKRRIDIQKTISGQAAVKSGLSKGDKVIVQGLLKVKPGGAVQISGENVD